MSDSFHLQIQMVGLHALWIGLELVHWMSTIECQTVYYVTLEIPRLFLSPLTHKGEWWLVTPLVCFAKISTTLQIFICILRNTSRGVVGEYFSEKCLSRLKFSQFITWNVKDRRYWKLEIWNKTLIFKIYFAVSVQNHKYILYRIRQQFLCGKITDNYEKCFEKSIFNSFS